MSEINKQKTPVAKLDIGMFVTALDRPWLGTPFLLEGILLEDQAQIATMQKLCQFVYIDRTMSVGDYFIAPPKANVAIKRTAGGHSGSKTTTKLIKRSPSEQKFTFYNILKEIQASNQAAKNDADGQNSTDNILLNIQNINDQVHTVGAIAASNDENTSFVSQMKEDFSSFISGLSSWGKKEKKLGSSIDKSQLKNGKGDTNDSATNEEASLVEDEIAEVYPVYDQSQVATREVFETLALGKKIDLSNVHESLDGMVESIMRNPDALIWLAKLKQTDNYAYNHALNVSITMMAFASFMSLSKAQIKNLGMAGLLQDVGKGKLPQDLLHKKGKISNAEFSILKKHVDYAIKILEETENIPASVIATIAQHHERIDGSGYPKQLSDKQISMSGQMAGLVDTYCAITTNKVYAKGVYNQVALEEIHKMRKIKFNSALVDQLVQFLGMYPVSSLVELNSGEVGVVIQQNSVRRLLPRVMLLLNPDKSKNAFPATINLITSPLTPNGEPYKIVRGLPADSYGLNASNYYA